MPAWGDPDTESWEQWPCGLVRLDAAGVIVAVNDRFLRQTGYDSLNLVGRTRWSELLAAGSRLLFETQLAPRLVLEGVVEEIMVDLVAVDGHRIPALVSAEAVLGENRVATGTRIALMTVPDRREYENHLRQAREEAERATSASAHVRARLELLAAANTALASSVDVDVALTRLAQTLVDEVADWCVIYAVKGDHLDKAQVWATAHSQPAKQELVERLAELIPRHSTPTSAISRVLDEKVPVLLAQVSADFQASATDNPAMLEMYGELGLASAMVIPSFARGQQVAALILARGDSRPSFTDDDLADLTDLGARTGLAIDNLRRHAREHSTSVALQQALLTSPPVIAPFTIVTRYLPATDGAEVGGDWYDAFAQPGGGVAIVIGDVVGHDIHAATQMGQLRGIIRTIANAIAGTPADALARADRAARSLQVNTLASAVLAQIEHQPSDATGGRIMLWSNAGHPPPILVTADGKVDVLERPADPLLGVRPNADRHDHSIEVHPGDTLVLYTDGLIERPDQDIDTGIARLTESLAGGHLRSATDLCDVIVAGHNGRQDDIAILVLRVIDSG